MVGLQQECVELLFERAECKSELSSGPRGVAVQVAQEHAIYRAKEALDSGLPGLFCASSYHRNWHKTSQADQLNFQILRRTMATQTQKMGSVKDIQVHLRHARADTTANEYMQELPESVMEMVGAVYDMSIKGGLTEGRGESRSGVGVARLLPGFVLSFITSGFVHDAPPNIHNGYSLFIRLQ